MFLWCIESDIQMRGVGLFALIWFQLTLVTVNYRAIAQKRYVMTALTDAIIAIGGFTVFKMIQQSDNSYTDIMGYVLGSTLGGLTGIYLTTFWKDDAK